MLSPFLQKSPHRQFRIRAHSETTQLDRYTSAPRTRAMADDVSEPLLRLLIVNPNTSRPMTEALKPMVNDLGYNSVSTPHSDLHHTFVLVISYVPLTRSHTHTLPAPPQVSPRSTRPLMPKNLRGTACHTSFHCFHTTTPSLLPATHSTHSSPSSVPNAKECLQQRQQMALVQENMLRVYSKQVS